MLDLNAAPHVVTALAALAGAIVGSLGNGIILLLVQWRKNKADEKLAEKKFTYERQQAIFKRRFELAEQVLADAYRFRDMMSWVRNGFANSGEGETRQTVGVETDSTKKIRNSYFVPIERLQSNSEFISAMMAKSTTCRAHFGKDAEEAFMAFNSAIGRVRAASSNLIMTSDYDMARPDNQKMRNECLNDIWEEYPINPLNDLVGTEIKAGIAKLEIICKPVLEWVDRP